MNQDHRGVFLRRRPLGNAVISENPCRFSVVRHSLIEKCPRPFSREFVSRENFGGLGEGLQVELDASGGSRFSATGNRIGRNTTCQNEQDNGDFQFHSQLSNFWFPGSAWEPTTGEALPRGSYRRFIDWALEAEPRRQCGPRQSLGPSYFRCGSLRPSISARGCVLQKTIRLRSGDQTAFTSMCESFGATTTGSVSPVVTTRFSTLLPDELSAKMISRPSCEQLGRELS